MNAKVSNWRHLLNKNMKKLIILLIAFLSEVNIYSQNQDIAFPNLTPLSPNAAEFAKYTDCPVSYYTGTPNINIPLYEIDVDGLKLPINLNYHASGIRVDQEATWVGLGWSLDVGSRISRSVNCTDDFLRGGTQDPNHPFVQTGYFYAPEQDSIFETHYDPPYSPTSLSENYFLACDSEPDVFFYNLPGMSGKFLLDKSRGAILFNKSHNLKIEVIKYGAEINFKITDPKGNQYLYNNTEITKSYSQEKGLNFNVHNEFTKYDSDALTFLTWTREEGSLPGYSKPYPMVTTWCLTKITTKNGREINFQYQGETLYLPTQESCENYNRGFAAGVFYYSSKNVNYSLRLKKIEWDLGYIDFTTSSRSDIKGDSEKLDAICIYNQFKTLIKCYKFSYNYFNDDYSGNSQYAHVFKRLKLNNVTEYRAATPSTPGYNTAYFATIPLNNGYNFAYYQGSFPPKNSKNVDYWGFQNGKEYGAMYYIGLKLNNTNFPGVKKDANFDKTIIGTLKKISYPTGGTAEYKFEQNTVSSSYYDTYTYEAPTTTNSQYVDLPAFNNYSSGSFPDIPPTQNYTFQVSSPITIKVTASLENQVGNQDPTYLYESNNNPLGRLQKISPVSNVVYTYPCPNVYSNGYQPQGSEITLTERQFTLDAGTYQFTAFTPPRDVYAFWRIFIPGSTTQPVSQTDPSKTGGIRISEIITDEKNRRFKYPTGSMIVYPVLYHTLLRNGVSDPLFPTPGSVYCTQVSESKTPLSSFNHGNFVGYDWVEEYMYDEDDNQSKIKYSFFNEGESDFFNDAYPDSPRYINYNNGLIASIEKSTIPQSQNLPILLEKENFEYKSTQSNIIKAFKDKGSGTPGIVGIRTLLQYYYQIEWPLQSKIIKTEKTDDGKTFVSETNYTYNSKDLLQSTSFIVDNSTVTEKVKYPFEFTTDPISVAMTAKNIIGIPIETISLKDNIVRHATKAEYANSSGFYLPKTIYKAEFSTPVSVTNFNSNSTSFYKPVLNFDSYNTKGSLLQFRQVNGVPTYYVWGYKEQYTIAKLENFTSTDATTIQSIITAAIDASNTDTSSVLEDALRTALTNLRNAASNAMVTTYTYDPQIGVTSITDPKGYTIYYQYDEFNRLKQVIDVDGHIVGKNEYNYKQ